ncbi:peptidase M50 [Anopheles sinensis]|uniref:Peptidase M50 n=1 Tax=Anopheles sinensis TaxID=74873 RepID=A0A084VVK5_ANOSI|nr:peptidase M50 [Anopheles sinensis]
MTAILPIIGAIAGGRAGGQARPGQVSISRLRRDALAARQVRFGGATCASAEPPMFERSVRS